MKNSEFGISKTRDEPDYGNRRRGVRRSQAAEPMAIAGEANGEEQIEFGPRPEGRNDGTVGASPEQNRDSNPSLPEASGCWLDHGSVAGVAIREDVRDAAVQLWAVACGKTRAVMGDTAETAALMEVAVAQASKYLDRLGQEASPARTSAVLMKIFSRLLRRRATRLERLQPAGQDMEFMASVSSWEDGVNAGIFLQQLERCMSRDGVTILTLRRDGHSWLEIAQMLRTTVAAVKKRFWREIEDAKITLGIGPPKKPAARARTQRKGRDSAA
ncbi:MAG TPA: hypothetical protein VJ723_13765 [Candidatus Angelobacter sp.]|nr:hypothetical protein [Candidatus Angelobacter sp.]